jgi:hypothetical protein
MFSMQNVIHNLTRLAVASDITEMATDIRKTGEGIEKLQLNRHEEQIRDWLSAVDPSTNYADALEKRHKGTGAWFTGSQAFDDWKKQPNSFLWLHGIPGCGKTVLSSTIVEHLSEITKPDQALLYFYFDFNEANKQTLENMLRSLINQLYQRQPDSRGPLDQLWNACRESNHPILKKSLGDVLLVMLNKVKDVSIILDALDESTTRNELLTWLRDVLRGERHACRMLVTARREEDIESALQRWILPGESMSLQRNDVNDDIGAYVIDTVRNSDKLGRWYGKPEVQNEIETELVKRADGM